ncbi:MAG: NAD-dependent epimerase/dehydratase family protein [Bacteroidota bacterium]
MQNPILLTGATGFLGHHLCRKLLGEGYQVRAFCRAESNKDLLPAPQTGFSIIEGDILDIFTLADAMEGCGAVIHTAALVSFQSKDKKQLYQTNQEGTANVVNLALDLKIPRLVYVSSVAALGRNSGSEKPTSLRDNWHHQRALTPYARSKFAAEREVWRAQAEGLSVGAVYPSIMVGAGDWKRGGSPGIFDHLAQGSRYYPNGSAGFVAVEDVVLSCLHLLQSEEAAERILCSAANLSWESFLTQAARALKVKPPSIRLRSWQTGLLWPIVGLTARIKGKKPMITRATHRTSQARFHYDGSSFETILGRSYSSVDEAIRRTAAAYLGSS